MTDASMMVTPIFDQLVEEFRRRDGSQTPDRSAVAGEEVDDLAGQVRE